MSEAQICLQCSGGGSHSYEQTPPSQQNWWLRMAANTLERGENRRPAAARTMLVGSLLEARKLWSSQCRLESWLWHAQAVRSSASQSAHDALPPNIPYLPFSLREKAKGDRWSGLSAPFSLLQPQWAHGCSLKHQHALALGLCTCCPWAWSSFPRATWTLISRPFPAPTWNSSQ